MSKIIDGRWLFIGLICFICSCKKTTSDASGSTGAPKGNVTVSTLAGSTGSGAFSAGPRGIIEDSKGNIFISTDAGSILEMNPSGIISVFSGGINLGCEAGNGTVATYSSPFDMAIDNADNIYVADHNCGGVKVVDGNGNSRIFSQTDANSGAYLSDPAAIAVDDQNQVYVADEGGQDGIVMIDVTGKATLFAGNQTAGDVDGPASQAEFISPTGICTDQNSDVFVAAGNKIRRISNGQVSTYAGSDKAGYQDGPGTQAGFGGGMGLCPDGQGNLYVADFYNQCIRKVSAGGAVTTVAGVPGQSGHLDGDGATSLFSAPTHLCMDKQGNLLIADLGNGGGALTGQGFIRKITFSK